SLPFVRRARSSALRFGSRLALAATQSVDEKVRAPRRLRLAIAAVARKRQLDRAFEVDEVSRRDEDRLHARLRPQGRADRLALVNERRPTPALLARLLEPPREHRLRTAERRAFDDESDVRSDADATRMRDSLPVEHHGVRLGLQLRPSLQNRRRLAERQKAGHVWKLRLA